MDCCKETTKKGSRPRSKNKHGVRLVCATPGFPLFPQQKHATRKRGPISTFPYPRTTPLTKGARSVSEKIEPPAPWTTSTWRASCHWPRPRCPAPASWNQVPWRRPEARTQNRSVFYGLRIRKVPLSFPIGSKGVTCSKPIR